jgi:hypothetical protein
MMLAADEVVIRFAVGLEGGQMLVEAMHQLVGELLDGPVGVDEFGVVIAQMGDHVWEAAFEMEEHRAAAEERLKIPVKVRGEKLVELPQQLRLPACPLQERLRFDAGDIGCVGKAHRLLLVVGVEPSIWFTATGPARHGGLRGCESGKFAGGFGFWLWIGSLIRPRLIGGFVFFDDTPRLLCHVTGSIPIRAKGSRSIFKAGHNIFPPHPLPVGPYG